MSEEKCLSDKGIFRASWKLSSLTLFLYFPCLYPVSRTPPLFLESEFKIFFYLIGGKNTPIAILSLSEKVKAEFSKTFSFHKRCKSIHFLSQMLYSSVKDKQHVTLFRCFAEWTTPVSVWSYPLIQFYFPITLQQTDQLTPGFLVWEVAIVFFAVDILAQQLFECLYFHIYITSKMLCDLQAFCSLHTRTTVCVFICGCLCALLMRLRGGWVGAMLQDDIFTFLHIIDFPLLFFFLPLNHAPFQQPWYFLNLSLPHIDLLCCPQFFFMLPFPWMCFCLCSIFPPTSVH